MTLTDAALVITLTWSTFKKAGVVLFLLSGWALFCGSLPDHSGSSFADSMRRAVWPLMLVWLVVLLIRALII